MPQLPPTFFTDLRTLLHKSTPLPPLRPSCSPPAVGFFSAQACRHYDVRHLSKENYEQPNKSVLVESNFRSKFAEQQRLAQEYYQQWWKQYQEQYAEQYGQELDPEHGQAQVQTQSSRETAPHLCPGTQTEKQNHTEKEEDVAERPSTGTRTAETVSPSKSRYGESPLPAHLHSPSRPQSRLASTAATSILGDSANEGPQLDPNLGLGPDVALDSHGMFLPVDTGLENENENASINATSSAMAVPVPETGPLSPFLQTPGLSAPRAPSGLSLLISASRNSKTNQEMEMGLGEMDMSWSTEEGFDQ